MAGAAFTFHLPTTDTPRAGRWSMYGPPAPSMRYDSYPAFEFVPGSRGETEPTRYGAFIAELDAVDDVMEAVREALKIIAHFEAVYGIAPEQWRLYLSGKRSVHLTLPAEVLGLENGHKLLPLIYKRVALDLTGNAGLKTLDLAMYKMGTGQPFRLSNKQRENGRYKVPLSVDEICEISDAGDYMELCSAPRPEPSRVAPVRSESLAFKVQSFTAEAEEAARVKPEPLDDETAKKLKKAMPACIEAISKTRKLPKSGQTFNAVSMQLIAYAVTAGLSEAETVQLFGTAIKNYPSPAKTPYAERLSAFKACYRYMAANGKGFSCAGVRALGFAGFDCKKCAVKKSEKGDGAVEVVAVEVVEPATTTSPDATPGLVPDSFLRVPGLVNEIMDYTLDTAPYPNLPLAFCGALALQAALTGRKVRDPGDVRTNIYIIGLAGSGAGKDQPRKTNVKVLSAIGGEALLGTRFASGEGLQDALFTEPCMLFQTDEIDGMLRSINKSKDARHESIMSTLLEMHSTANSAYVMRRKAGDEAGRVIYNPHMVLFGTAIPKNFYEALSERMLENGMLARSLNIDCGKRASGQEPRMRPLPERVTEVAAHWFNYAPGGNLAVINPVPATVPVGKKAQCRLKDLQTFCDGEYGHAEDKGDVPAMTVWARVYEQARKLALIYATSENHERPEIGEKGVQWAGDLALRLARRMLFLASEHVADNNFEAEAQKVRQKLRAAKDMTLAHSILLKRMKLSAADFGKVMETLGPEGTEEVDFKEVRAGTKPSMIYTLLGR